MQQGINAKPKQDLKTILSKEALAKAESLVKIIDKSKLPAWERSGNQKYVFMDSDKNPYTGGYTIQPGVRNEIHTDGELTKTKMTVGGNTSQEFFTVKDYEYIVTKVYNKGKLISQTVVTADLRFKMYLQQLLGLPQG